MLPHIRKQVLRERTLYNLPATAVNAFSLKIHLHPYAENLKTHLVFITEQNCMNKLITLTDCSCLCNCCSLFWHRERVIPAVAMPCLIRQQHCPLLSPGKNCTYRVCQTSCKAMENSWYEMLLLYSMPRRSKQISNAAVHVLIFSSHQFLFVLILCFSNISEYYFKTSALRISIYMSFRRKATQTLLSNVSILVILNNT